MTKEKVLFYDFNSTDAHLSRLICGILYDFKLVAVGSNQNTSNIEYYNPASIFEDETTFETYFFVGVKPSIEFCQKINNSKIVIVDSGFLPNFYLQFINVNVVELLVYKTMSNTLLNYLSSSHVYLIDKSAINYKSAINDLVRKFDNYTNTYMGIILNFSDYSVNAYLNNLKKVSDESFGLAKIIFINEGSDVNYYRGKLIYDINYREMVKLLSSAIKKTVFNIDGSIKNRIIAINADIETIQRIDLLLQKYLIRNALTFLEFDFVEYYQIDQNKNILVRAKNCVSLLSPVEIKTDQELIDLVGYEKNLELLEYISNKYTQSIIKNNFDGTKSYTTSMELFFAN
jgi:hypothetical protein